MLSTTLMLHSLLRWAVVILLLVASASAIFGWLGKREWTGRDNKLGKWLTMSADIQLLLGILLYIISPSVKAARADFGAAMSDAGLRFWSVEHSMMMLLAIVLIHVGRARSKRAIDAIQKHKQAAIFFGIATLLMFVAVPWPWMAQGRDLLPF
jgi:hypothetical protein